MRLKALIIAKFNIVWAGHRPGKHPPLPPARPLGGPEKQFCSPRFSEKSLVGIFLQASAQIRLRVLSFERLYSAPCIHFIRLWWWVTIQAKYNTVLLYRVTECDTQCDMVCPLWDMIL